MPTLRRRPLVIAATVMAAALALTACHDPGQSSLPQPSKAFCDAAVKYDAAVQKVTKQSAAERARSQLPLVEKMATSAPPDIRQAARTFADAMRRRADGDTSVVDAPQVTKAVNDVNRRAGNGCGFYKSQDGGGGI